MWRVWRGPRAGRRPGPRTAGRPGAAPRRGWPRSGCGWRRRASIRDRRGSRPGPAGRHSRTPWTAPARPRPGPRRSGSPTSRLVRGRAAAWTGCRRWGTTAADRPPSPPASPDPAPGRIHNPRPRPAAPPRRRGRRRGISVRSRTGTARRGRVGRRSAQAPRDSEGQSRALALQREPPPVSRVLKPHMKGLGSARPSLQENPP